MNAPLIITIDGKTYPVTVTSKGRFAADIDGDSVTADSFAGLEKKLRTVSRRSRVSVPVTRVNTPTWRSDKQVMTVEHGTLTGIHATNQRLLYKSKAGKSESLSNHGDGLICRPLSEAEVSELRALFQAKVDAEAAFDKRIKAIQINGHEAVRKASNTEGED